MRHGKVVAQLVPPARRGKPIFHRDPFDRILIAQAAAEGLTLLSADETIRRYPINVLW